MRRHRRLGAAAVLAVLSAPLPAHDFWIEPSTFRPAPGSEVSLRLLVGPHFQGEPFPRVPRLVSQFVVVTAAGRRDVAGEPGDEPAGKFRADAPGLYLVGYRSLDTPLALEAAKFEEYLAEEGLEDISRLRRERGQSDRPVQEVFSRAAKALIAAGGSAQGPFDRTLGFSLEIVPEQNPYTLSPGGSLPVRVLHEGRPLAGILVQALRHGDPASTVKVRTAKDGRARLKLARPGFWMVKAVQMREAPRGVNAQWQSIWASLTFDLAGTDPVGKAP